MLENVLLQVKGLVFPVDFYILDMKNDKSPNSSPIILGQPFLRITIIKIDVHARTLTMEIDGEIVEFNIFNAMWFSGDVYSVMCLNIIDYCVEMFDLNNDDKLNMAGSQILDSTCS